MVGMGKCYNNASKNGNDASGVTIVKLAQWPDKAFANSSPFNTMKPTRTTTLARTPHHPFSNQAQAITPCSGVLTQDCYPTVGFPKATNINFLLPSPERALRFSLRAFASPLQKATASHAGRGGRRRFTPRRIRRASTGTGEIWMRAATLSFAAANLPPPAAPRRRGVVGRPPAARGGSRAGSG